MKLNDLITESILDLGKWHAEESSRWSMTYWYFIDIQHTNSTMGIYTHDGYIYVGLLSDRHLKRVAGRSKTLIKPPLIKLKHHVEKKETISKIFSPYGIRRS